MEKIYKIKAFPQNLRTHCDGKTPRAAVADTEVPEPECAIAIPDKEGSVEDSDPDNHSTSSYVNSTCEDVQDSSSSVNDASDTSGLDNSGTGLSGVQSSPRPQNLHDLAELRSSLLAAYQEIPGNKKA